MSGFCFFHRAVYAREHDLHQPALPSPRAALFANSESGLSVSHSGQYFVLMGGMIAAADAAVKGEITGALSQQALENQCVGKT